MLSIRLRRTGKKKQPQYRIIVLDKRKDPWGKFIENLGNYNPRTKPNTINLKADRIKYWLGIGAQPTATVHNMLVDEKVIDAKKVKATIPKKKEKAEENAKKEEKSTSTEATKDKSNEEESKTAESATENKPTEETKKETK